MNIGEHGRTLKRLIKEAKADQAKLETAKGDNQSMIECLDLYVAALEDAEQKLDIVNSEALLA